MFKITWDKENNGVLLTMKSSDEALNVSPRPVFFEELDLLGLNKHWKYPKSILNSAINSENNSIFA